MLNAKTIMTYTKLAQDDTDLLIAYDEPKNTDQRTLAEKNVLKKGEKEKPEAMEKEFRSTCTLEEYLDSWLISLEFSRILGDNSSKHLWCSKQEQQTDS